MKCTLVLVVLCALVATICAMPEPLQHKQQQLRYRQQMAQMQRRMWSPVRHQPKWAMRRSSEEGVIAEDQQIAEHEEQAVAEELAAETAGANEEQTVEQAADEQADAVEAENEAPAALVPSFPPHTFFPMNFGQTSGGSVAVANSFSTGAGNAFSHAVAHGQRKP